jgi:hypothetical protein
VADAAKLRTWTARALAHASMLPPKPEKARAPASRIAHEHVVEENEKVAAQRRPPKCAPPPWKPLAAGGA